MDDQSPLQEGEKVSFPPIKTAAIIRPILLSDQERRRGQQTHLSRVSLSRLVNYEPKFVLKFDFKCAGSWQNVANERHPRR